jgi:diguanylate cyclase (GGDEF)-like protein
VGKEQVGAALAPEWLWALQGMQRPRGHAATPGTPRTQMASGADISIRVGQHQIAFITASGPAVLGTADGAFGTATRHAHTGTHRRVTTRTASAADSAASADSIALLHAIAVAANEATHSAEIARDTLRRVCAHIGWPIAHLYLRSGDSTAPLQPSDIFSPAALERYPAFCAATRASALRFGEGLPGRVFAHQRPVVVRDLTNEDSSARHDVARASGIRAGMAVPVLVGREVAAVLEFYSDESTRPGPGTIELLEQVCAQLGRVIERERSAERFTDRALHDPLTGLPNRDLLRTLLAATLEKTRHAGAVAVLFLDLDGFTLINDSLGHSAGDELLVQVSARLRQAVRPGDELARFGGDEFVIVAQDIKRDEDALHLADRIIDLAALPFCVGSTEVFLTTSIGIATTRESEADPAALVRDAAAALYRAKAAGRGGAALFTEAMRVRALERLQIVSDLHRAMERNELELHYQPQYALGTHTISGVEALVRWNHPERGLVPPSEFIPLAEETGIIVALGRWVLREACTQAQRWREHVAPLAPLSMSVNLSPRQLQQPRLVEDVAATLAETGLDPRLLTLEITESIALDDLDATVQRLQALKALGVRISIDDFGTGYSYLAYLRKLPIDELKIDKSFVDGLGTHGDQSAVAEAIVRLARSCGLTTVAEGVEELHQVDALRALSCESAQGFYFARPLTAAALDQLIAAHIVRSRIPSSPFGENGTSGVSADEEGPSWTAA